MHAKTQWAAKQFYFPVLPPLLHKKVYGLLKIVTKISGQFLNIFRYTFQQNYYLFSFHEQYQLLKWLELGLNVGDCVIRRSFEVA